MINRNQVYTVKIYFIEPVEIISIVVDTLVKMEFESYIVRDIDKFKLLKILKTDIRNVIFLSIINEKELERYLPYIDELNKITDSLAQVGAFVHENIKEPSRIKLLERLCAAIRFLDIQQDPLGVMKKILTYFEARGTRKYVRAKVVGICEAYFTVKTLEGPIKAIVSDISSHAFLCKIEIQYHSFFLPGDFFHDVLLILKGSRIRTSAKVIGFNKEAPDIFIFQFYTARMINKKFSYEEKLHIEITSKLHNYIKFCLKENLANQLDAITEE